MNSYQMTSAFTFEREKNIKALGFTMGVCIALFLIFFLVKWQLPQVTPPPVMEAIEVNLGNSDEGLGDVAPEMPGDPAPAKDEQYAPPQAAQPAAQQQNIAADENEQDEDAPAVEKPVKAAVKPVVNNTPVVPKPKATVQPVTNPTPAPPKPKAVYGGGPANGTGGNNADSYNGVTNQGIAGGKGDQGKAGGNPKSDSYNGSGGTGGSSAVKIKNGLRGRNISKMPSFEDDFNENAVVVVNIKVDANGNVTDASVNPKGTTTSNGNIRAIALRKARQLKLTPGEDDDMGSLQFVFKLRG